MNKKVYFISAFLVVLAGAIIAAKVIYGGHNINPEVSKHLWRVKTVINITGKGERAKVRMTLPQDNIHQIIYNEHFENAEMVFYIRERPLTGNRIGFWRNELLEGSKSIQYSFSAQLKKNVYAIPPSYNIPKSPKKTYPAEMQVWVDPSTLIQSQDPAVKQHLKNAVGKERNASRAMRNIFDFVRGEVKYRSEKGSKDAKEALKKLEADCGGQARLFAALSRAAGLPSRLVGGLIMESGIKSTTHVWVENYIAGEWVPFDTVNNHFAETPANYVELYRGDYPLFKHVGLSKFQYFFVIGPERIPPVDNPWSLYVLPIHFQNFIKVLLLIPLGALVVAVFRSVIGVPTFGTFAPILLALAFQEISLFFGLLCLVGIIFLGWVFRTVLDHLKILVIPRLSLIVTLVVMLVLVMVVVFYHLGQQRILFITLFPMIIMTWTIERYSVIQIEDGTRAALRTALGTAIVAIAAYYLMGIHMLRVFLFAFPELLLVIMALLLILGRYTGIRLTEIVRFKEIFKIKR